MMQILWQAMRIGEILEQHEGTHADDAIKPWQCPLPGCGRRYTRETLRD